MCGQRGKEFAEPFSFTFQFVPCHITILQDLVSIRPSIQYGSGILGPRTPNYKPGDHIEVRVSSNQSFAAAAGSFSLDGPLC